MRRFAPAKARLSGTSSPSTSVEDRTLQLISRPPVFRKSQSLAETVETHAFELSPHLPADKRMAELQNLVKEFKKAEESRASAPVGFAMLLLSGGIVAFVLTDIWDAGGLIHYVLPSPFALLRYESALELLNRLARWNMLPVDYQGDDPYLSQLIHTGTNVRKISIPVGLSGELCHGVREAYALFKLGFGFAEVRLNSGNAFNDCCVIDKRRAVVYSISETVGSRASASNTDSNSSNLNERAIELANSMNLVRQEIENGVKGTELSRHGNVMLTIPLGTNLSRSVLSQVLDSFDMVCFDLSAPGCEAQNLADSITLVDEQLRNALGDRTTAFDSAVFVKVPAAQQPFVLPETIQGVYISSQVKGRYDEKSSTFTIGSDGARGRGSDQLAQRDSHVLDGPETLLLSCHSVKQWREKNAMRKKPLTVVASGGVASGNDAMEAINSGANLVIADASFVLDGLLSARRTKGQLSGSLVKFGYPDLASAVGNSPKHTYSRSRIKFS